MIAIPGHPMYSIDTEGNVWSKYVNRMIKPTLRVGDTSYYKVGLLLSSKPKKYKHMYLHQLVLLTYVGPRPRGMEIDHIDGDSTNNRLNNLRYVTPKQNSENRTKCGKHYKSFDKKIDTNMLVSLKDAGYRHCDIATTLNVSERQISRILNELKKGGN